MSIANSLRCDGCGRPFLGKGRTAEEWRALAALSGWTRAAAIDLCRKCSAPAELRTGKATGPRI